MHEKEGTKIVSVVKVFADYLKKPSLLLVLAIVGSMSASISTVFYPVFLKKFFDAITTSGGFSEQLYNVAFNALVWVLIVSALSHIFWRTTTLTVNAFASRTMKSLFVDAYAYTSRHAHSFFQNSFVGSLVRKIDKFAESFNTILEESIYQILPLVVEVTGMLLIIFSRSPLIGLAVLLWVILFLGANYVTFRWMQKYEVERSEADSAISAALSDSITNNAEVRSFANFGHERTLLSTVVERWRVQQLKIWNLNEVVRVVQGALSIAIEIFVLFASLHLYRQGTLTIGDFVLFQMYIVILNNLVWNFYNVFRSVFRSFSNAHEMVEILETPHAVADARGALALQVTKGDIVFDHVAFAYNQTRTILKDFSLHITAGEKIAFVGPSGAGKSTVTKLLMRFFDVSGGSIRIDGQDVAHVQQDSLHGQVSLVPQEPMLFHRSLMDNIRYGRLDATDEEVYEAAKKAHCHEFVTALPDGYNTLVGERGVKLSGGERQRVAIARAILKNAPILILDEATSSLDSESESLIQEALAELMKGKTVLVIAHRLSTIMKMDRIVVVEQGAVRATGTHEELLHTDDLYKKLWSIQAGGFIGE